MEAIWILLDENQNARSNLRIEIFCPVAQFPSLHRTLSERICPGTPQDEQVREHIDHVVGIQPPCHPDGQRLAGELIDDVQHAPLAAVMRAILDKVV